MTLSEIANELVAGCREGREAENLAKLYAEDAVSVEAADPGGMGREAKGLEAIRGKHAWWESAFEFLEGTIDGPYEHGDDRFAVHFKLKTKNKETGEVSDMAEVGVYHVAGGKITREEFFYTM
ncbi:MAG: nuclear transport factor 2 family protein [Pseudomonadota bacterium]